MSCLVSYLRQCYCQGLAGELQGGDLSCLARYLWQCYYQGLAGELQGGYLSWVVRLLLLCLTWVRQGFSLGTLSTERITSTLNTLILMLKFMTMMHTQY